MQQGLPYIQLELYSCSAHDLDDYLRRMRIEHLPCANPFKCKAGALFNNNTQNRSRRFFMGFPSKFEVVNGNLVLILDCEQLRIELQSGAAIDYPADIKAVNGILDIAAPYIPLNPNWDGPVPKFGLLSHLPIFLHGEYSQTEPAAEIR